MSERESSEKTEYVCGRCGKTVLLDNNLTNTDDIKCQECGYAILYKKRKESNLQILAR